MQISLEADHKHYSIISYAPGCLTLAQPRQTPIPSSLEERKTTVQKSCILTPDSLYENWPPQCFDDFTAEHFAALLPMAPELVILGTGSRLRFPISAILAPLMTRGIGVEVMNTAAACRTYNFLMVDGRNVLAALLL
ncbi:MAG: Mth938-like domain-containing protein [Pseudomonadota bacterium]